MSFHQPKIAIIGGGPAGLTLGVLLHRHGIPINIFELRQKPTEEELEGPAGSLDLHEGSGLAAIRECDLFDEFLTLTGDCAEAGKVSDKEGNILHQDEGDAADRPEISRNKLIRLLMSQLPDSAIKWDHKLISAKSCIADMSNEIALDFGVQGIHKYDFVVGADGAWSRVRALLTDVQPHYTGIQNVTLNIREVTTRYPQLADFIGNGSFAALANKHGVLSQRSVHDSTRIYLFISTPDPDFSTTIGISDLTPAQAKDRFIGDGSPFYHWGPKIKELVTVACEDESAVHPAAKVDVKPLHTLPPGHVWVHQPGATLIGDASHLVNPPAGEGVNVAMKDALLLSKTLIKALASSKRDSTSFLGVVDSPIKEFEINMAAEAKDVAEMSLRIGDMMFGSDDGATAMANFFKQAIAAHSQKRF